MPSSVSDVVIGNLALGHLGVANQITTLEQRSSEGRAVKRFYERARDTTQSRYPWKCGLKKVTLAELASNAWSDELLHAYRIPTDCKWFRRLCIGQGTAQKGPPFRIVSDDAGEVILTNQEQAVAEYSILVADPTKWSDEQVNATSYKLAALMARTFDEDNASATRKDMEQQYEIELARAAAKDLNQEEPPDPPKSELETCRW